MRRVEWIRAILFLAGVLEGRTERQRLALSVAVVDHHTLTPTTTPTADVDQAIQDARATSTRQP